MTETSLLAMLRRLPLHPGARGLADDAAVIGDLVVTKDMLVEGVHYRADDPPGDVAWKLVAVNLSDLAAKGAVPVGVLSGITLGDAAWDRAFVEGLGAALTRMDVPLLGGDTVAAPARQARVLSLTAIGRSAHAPDRAGAVAGDGVWLCGTIGDAGAGLRMLERDPAATGPLVAAYRRPTPLMADGQRLAATATAMMDVSDGLLIDAARIAEASGVAIDIDLDMVPLSPAGSAFWGDDVVGAATAGDDYALLLTAPGAVAGAVRIGSVRAGTGLRLTRHGAPLALPQRLGWLHG
ncbi:thiamine-monophosphate kinase [Sphingomonas jejuensis]|uniref:Thiamine-monophosphate kinase n=1 Tax=Sphingomonas jejuensis TaxID=904715 RepID=A0ABX0XP95_9SPHN|nr:thiamine-phosphate kinase [Sphingomonas jejuensis]NJC35218.1 thiamine-monophosphate kinase [Sphingomonas jejuensis]